MGVPGLGEMHWVFLDWEKVFDRFRQDELIECSRRMNIDEKMIRAISSSYAGPAFAVRVGTNTSDWLPQMHGINQACPISPYFFLVVMTVLVKECA